MRVKKQSTSSEFEFFQFLDGAPLFERADKTLNGSIPLRAYTHCEPLTAASSFGWQAGAPFDFGLKWDGAQTWIQTDSSDWQPFTRFTPAEFLSAWERHKPKSLEIPPCPLLIALREPGHVQIWTGLIARIPERYNLLIRGLPNIPGSGYETLEGILESSWWHGPIFTVIRICQTNAPLFFTTKQPFVSLQPVEKQLLQNEFYKNTSIQRGSANLPEELWLAYADAVALHRKKGPPGGYKEACKARRKMKGAEADD